MLMLVLGCLIIVFTTNKNKNGNELAYFAAVIATVVAWFVGLELDLIIDAGGVFSFGTLFPTLAMGLCIFNAILKKKSDQ